MRHRETMMTIGPGDHTPLGGFTSGDDGPLVRPYAMTGGRTRSRIDIAIESLFTTTTRGERSAADRNYEWQRITTLCRNVQSLAEIAAYLGVPLGVARVIVGDMTEAGLLDVHEPGRLDDQLGTYLLERVLSGLRKL